MNIFLVDTDPIICAQALCDTRLNKMILETAQMLCVAYRHHFPQDAKINEKYLYALTHANHPCNKWLKEDLEHYVWCLNLFEQLHEEKLYRTQVSHKSFTDLYDILGEPIGFAGPIYDIDFTFNCSNIEPSTGDVFEDYKLCLQKKWLADKRTPTWRRRGQPEWFNIQRIGAK